MLVVLLLLLVVVVVLLLVVVVVVLWLLLVRVLVLLRGVPRLAEVRRGPVAPGVGGLDHLRAALVRGGVESIKKGIGEGTESRVRVTTRWEQVEPVGGSLNEKKKGGPNCRACASELWGDLFACM